MFKREWELSCHWCSSLVKRAQTLTNSHESLNQFRLQRRWELTRVAPVSAWKRTSATLTHVRQWRCCVATHGVKVQHGVQNNTKKRSNDWRPISVDFSAQLSCHPNMLKYCEQYRNMRESLCREHARTDYCRRNAEAVSPPHSRRAGLQITSLPCDEFPAPTATKSCSLAKDGTVKSKSDEEDGIEKQHRRPSVNFEKEFTFTPRLNLASVRMARERTGKARESIERRANALVAEVQMKFTFKPKVSSRSEKIAQGLKTSFFERQLIHVERQRKMVRAYEVSFRAKTFKEGPVCLGMLSL